MICKWRHMAFLLCLCVGHVAGDAPVLASIGKHPRVEIDCVRSRTVLRPEFGASLDDLRPGDRMALVQMRICSHERRTCVAYGEEVPLSRCGTDTATSDDLGILTTE